MRNIWGIACIIIWGALIVTNIIHFKEVFRCENETYYIEDYDACMNGWSGPWDEKSEEGDLRDRVYRMSDEQYEEYLENTNDPIVF